MQNNILHTNTQCIFCFVILNWTVLERFLNTIIGSNGYISIRRKIHDLLSVSIDSKLIHTCALHNKQCDFVTATL